MLRMHARRRGEAVFVPREVALAIRVLDIQPEHIEGQVVLVELRVHRAHVLLVLVVPPALVVAEGEEGGKRRDARERRVLARDVCRRRAAEEEGLHLQPYVIGAATVRGRGCNPM